MLKFFKKISVPGGYIPLKETRLIYTRHGQSLIGCKIKWNLIQKPQLYGFTSRKRFYDDGN